MRVTVPVTPGARALRICAAQALSPPVVRRDRLPVTTVFQNAACGTQRNRLNNRQAAGWVVVVLPADACQLVVRALDGQVSHARALVCNAMRSAVGLSRAMGGQERARCGS